MKRKHETYIYEVTRERNQRITESGGNINVAKSKQKQSPNGNIKNHTETRVSDPGRIRNGVRIVGS